VLFSTAAGRERSVNVDHLNLAPHEVFVAELG
jgi:hypothetical protein